MKINITKKEYRLLIDLLYLGDWMITAHLIHSEDDKHKKYEDLRTKMFSYYKEMGASDIIEYSKDPEGYFELGGYDKEMHANFVDPYNESVFWEKLINALSARDLVRSIGEEAYRAMDVMGRIKMLEEYRQKYMNEFADRGIDNLMLAKQVGTL